MYHFMYHWPLKLYHRIMYRHQFMLMEAVHAMINATCVRPLITEAGHCFYVIISWDVWACWMFRCLLWRSPETRGTSRPIDWTLGNSLIWRLQMWESFNGDDILVHCDNMLLAGYFHQPSKQRMRFNVVFTTLQISLANCKSPPLAVLIKAAEEVDEHLT